MAVSYTKLGQVDVSPGVIGRSDQPTDLSLVACDITVSVATTDYTSVGIAPAASQLGGLTQVVGIVGGQVRASGGGISAVIPQWDVANSTIRLYLPNVSGTIAATNANLLTEITAANTKHLNDTDIVRVFAVGW